MYVAAVPTRVDIFVPLADLASTAADFHEHLVPAVEGDAARRQSWRAALQALALERAAQTAGIARADISHGRLLRRSLDARKGYTVGFHLQVELLKQNEAKAPQSGFGDASSGPARLPAPAPVCGERRAVVVGSGPAGTFAALRLAQAGARVTLVEQGKPVQPRRKDLALLTRGQLVVASNYCFGEGGAGTYSDGKLYTRCKDRQAVAETLAVLIEHGADADIAVESRPHIGSNRLPQILAVLRQHLIALGVEYCFEQRVEDLLLTQKGQLAGVRCASGLEVFGDVVVLAVGHSARQIYELCAKRGIALAPKPFAIGVRIEHPQPLIDRLQYGSVAEHPALPAAFYQLTAQALGRGVYSFCMCPGGWIVPSATEPEGLCTNGMSLKRRDSPLANAALVVTVEPTDYAATLRTSGALDTLAGVAFQRSIERKAYLAGGGDFMAPAQCLSDFLAGRPSLQVLHSTYRPGVRPGDLSTILPDFVTAALRAGLQRFDRTLPGFVTQKAQLVGVETRTSSPVRIVREPSLMSPSLLGLYPIGEGAGYAGGIVSAAIDGLRTADAVLANWR